METKKITIAGAGLVGSLLSIYLAKKGHDVEIYERRPDTRKANIPGGRSINLALSDRGWRALERAGLGPKIKEMSIPMYRRVMHDKNGNLSFQNYGLNNEAIYSVSRGGLNKRLMELAEATNKVKINFNQKCLGADLEEGTAHFENYETKEKTTVKADLLFGADGAFSAIRGQMLKRDKFNYSQEYIDHGYKELSIPANEDGSHRMEREALHIWPRGHYMLIALPNPDGTFTCTLFFPNEGVPSFESLKSAQEAREFFKEEFPDALAMMPNFDEEWNENPDSSLVIIRSYPWKIGNTTILGDASHAIVPFYGQGMNSGFEDCDILGQLMDQDLENWDEILDAFQKERKPNADAIADLAMRNFIEMRDLTADPVFLLRKKIENRFSTKYPQKWLPLYSMVTFSHIPYHKALELGKKHDAIMHEIMSMNDIETKWDSQEVEDRMLELSKGL